MNENISLPDKLQNLLSKTITGSAPTRDDCVYMLSFEEKSIEASAVRAVLVQDHNRFGTSKFAFLLLAYFIEIKLIGEYFSLPLASIFSTLRTNMH
jgi:hypothetical protein